MNKTKKTLIRQFKGTKNKPQINLEATISEHHCKEDPDLFCYVCSKFNTLKPLRQIFVHFRMITEDCLEDFFLYKRTVFAPITVAYSTTLKENYEDVMLVFDRLKYLEDNWQIFGDFNILGIILGQQIVKRLID